MSLSQQSPLARLIVFIACLAVLGSIIAGAHYYAVDLPQQKQAPPPDNGIKLFTQCDTCHANCNFVPDDYYDCMSECDMIC